MGHDTSYDERILLLVTGLSPQVVTETLYALCVDRTPPFIPTRIQLVTTEEGAERAKLLLLNKNSGYFYQFCKDYDLDSLSSAFCENHIHVLHQNDGHPLQDIETDEDNAIVADTIMRFVRDFASNPGCAIHASVAGGRKTMGVALALAMSLFGRPQDALSHVLVSPPFESHPEFFYPPPEPRVLLVGAPPQQRPVPTEKAEVRLAEIPFLRLSGLLDETLLQGAYSWCELITRAQAHIGSPQLVIDLSTAQVRAGGVQVGLRPVEKAFLLMMARAAKERRLLRCPPDGAPDRKQARLFLEAMRDLGHAGPHHDRTRQALERGMDKGFFERNKSNVNAALRKALGPGPAVPYLIGRHKGADGQFVHGLTLPAESIEIV